MKEYHIFKDFRIFIDKKTTKFEILYNYYEEIIKALINNLKVFPHFPRKKSPEQKELFIIYEEIIRALRVKKLKYEWNILTEFKLIYGHGTNVPVTFTQGMQLFIPFLTGDTNLKTFEERLKNETELIIFK